MNRISEIVNNPAVIEQYVNGVINARKQKSNTYDLAFVKEENGRWYIDMPHWQGAHSELQMVAGADLLLEGLLEEGNRVKVQLVKSQQKLDEYETDASYVKCHLIDESLFDGATYTVIGMEEYVKEMWICPVTLFVLGEYPMYLYIKKV